jgi:hypothetical protein
VEATWYWSTSPTPTFAGMGPEKIAVLPETCTVRALVFRLAPLTPTDRYTGTVYSIAASSQSILSVPVPPVRKMRNRKLAIERSAALHERPHVSLVPPSVRSASMLPVTLAPLAVVQLVPASQES